MWLDIVNYHTTSNGDNTSNHLYENYLSQLRQELVECVCVIFFFLKFFNRCKSLWDVAMTMRQVSLMCGSTLTDGEKSLRHWFIHKH